MAVSLCGFDIQTYEQASSGWCVLNWFLPHTTVCVGSNPGGGALRRGITCYRNRWNYGGGCDRQRNIGEDG